MATVKSVNGDYSIIANSGAGNIILGGNSKTSGGFVLLAADNTGAIAEMGIITQTGANTFAGLRFDKNTGTWQVSSDVTADGGAIAPYGVIATDLSNYSNANVQAYLPTYSGNLTSLTGDVTTTANISGDYFIGNGSQLTGITTYGNADVANYLPSYSGNITNLNVTGTLTATTPANGTSNTQVATTEFVSAAVILSGSYGNANVANYLPTYTGSIDSLNGDVKTNASIIGSYITSSGNIDVFGNVNTNQYVYAVGGINTLGNIGLNGSLNFNGPNPSLSVGNGNLSAGNISASSNVFVGSTLIVSGVCAVNSIDNLGAPGTGDIGTAAIPFNTVYALATSAQYADLAEMYCADAKYPPGTIVEFGGEYEITITTRSNSTAVAGVVSTNPSYLMNSVLACEEDAVAVALVGRVPCFVVGTIRKGDLIVSSNIAGVGQALVDGEFKPGCVIGKALENYDSTEVGSIEVVVGVK